MSAPNSNSTTNASSASRNPEPCAEPALSESAQAGESNGCPVQTAVMGVSGYAGMELARLLLRHPSLAGSPPLFLSRPDSTPEPLAAVHPHLMDNNGTGLDAGGLRIEPFSWDLLGDRGVKILSRHSPRAVARVDSPGPRSRLARHRPQRRMAFELITSNRAVYQLTDKGSAASLRAGRPSRLRHAGAASRRDSRRRAGRESRLLRHLDHPGPRAARRAGWIDLDRGIVGRRQIRRLRRREKAYREHTLHARCRQSLRLRSLFAHRHTGEMLEQLGLSEEQIDFHARICCPFRAEFSQPYTCGLEKARRPGEIESSLSWLLCRSPLVRVFACRQAAADSILGQHQLLRIGFQLAATAGDA